MRWLFLFLVLLASPPPPSSAQAAWISASTARLSWVQESDANMACLTSVSASGDFFNAVEDCIPSRPGFNSFDLTRTIYPYGTYYPITGDAYYIAEWRIDGTAQTYLGHYGPFILERAQDVRLPLVIR